MADKETVTLKLPSGEEVDFIVPAGLSDAAVKTFVLSKRPDFFVSPTKPRLAGIPFPPAQPPITMDTAGPGTATGPGMVPNPKTAIAMAGDDPSGFTGGAIAGLTAAGAAGMALGAGGGTAAGTATLRALAPIAKRYGIKALEGAGLASGWQLYRELRNVFEGNGK